MSFSKVEINSVGFWMPWMMRRLAIDLMKFTWPQAGIGSNKSSVLGIYPHPQIMRKL